MRTRILATADNHFHVHTRFAECIRVHDWMVDLVRKESVDLVLDAGDIYETGSEPLEREAVKSWLLRMGEVAPVVIAKGNHEIYADLRILASLRARHPIIVEEGADVHVVRGVAVAAFAWPDTASLTSRASSVAGMDADVRAALRDVFRGLGAELRQHDGPRIALGHAMIDGSIASTNQPLLGLPINVSLEELMLIGASLGLYGHIHRGQWWEGIDGSRHGYLGSPFRTDFGQTEPKSVTIATFEGSKLVSVEQVETPATKMAHIQATWTAAGFDGGEAAGWDVRGVELRLRYKVAAHEQEAAAAAAAQLKARLLGEGAVDVKVEPEVLTEKRARAPEVAAARSLPEKLERHWESVGFDPGDRRAALLEKAHRLEEETRDVA